MNFPSLGVTSDDPGKFVLGTVPVEADGSAYFHVPAGVTLFFQALDEKGRAVQTMRSGVYVQPGQTYSCIGCHERRRRPRRPILRRPPSASRHGLSPAPRAPGRWISMPLVQPVLDQNCRPLPRPAARQGEV